MDDDEYGYFWETDDIWDLQGDLLIWSLIGVCAFSFQEAIFYSYEYAVIIETSYKHNLV
jgi:hypothetical protein